jgi:hypothetical protein
MPNIEKKDVTLNLPVILTDEERISLGADMARANQERSRAEARKKEANAQFKAEIEKHLAEVSRLGALIPNGYEYRDVPCELMLDFDRGRAMTFRKDTGVKVHERDIHPDELQARIDFDRANPVPDQEDEKSGGAFPDDTAGD